MREYKQIAYVNLESSKSLQAVFSEDFDVRRIIEFKGALTEQFVIQQLILMKEMSTFYWSAEKTTAEIDFLVQFSSQIIPIEVKAEENLKAKSLKLFCQKYKLTTAIRTSMSNFRKEDWLLNLPL